MKNVIALTSFAFFMISCSADSPPISQEPKMTPAAVAENKTLTVSSPDGNTRFDLSFNSETGMRYSVFQDGDMVLSDSALGLKVGFTLGDRQTEQQIADFNEKINWVSQDEASVEDRYTLFSGKRVENEYAANTLSVTMRDRETEKTLRLDIHAANDGVAFRYVLPGESLLFHQILSETTEFNFGEGGKIWAQPHDFPTHWKPAYELPFRNGDPIGTSIAEDEGTGWAFPALFKDENDRYVLLSDTDLTKDYHGVHLDPDASGGRYRVKGPLAAGGAGYGSTVPAATLPLEMPWRMLVISDDLGDILETNRTHDLARPPADKDWSWVKPGLSSWSWWSDHTSSRSATAMLPFIDFAAEMGWPYSLIDANWNTISDTSMQDLVSYADERDVDLLFWYNSGGRHNFVTEEPRNIMNNRIKRRAEFAKLQRLGVKGVKIDFFHSDKQDRIAQYIDILEDAADFEILVNFHGSTIPRGWQRTYPHLMTMESVWGSEVYTFPAEPNYGEVAVWQNTILPFTRNAIGSMDYTPVNFSDRYTPHTTTSAHEAALGVVFESGLQHLSDSVESYRAVSPAYKAYLKTLPNVWDETRYISGEPGDSVVLARRNGDKWWVAGLNGTQETKTISLDLTPYSAGTLLYDGPTDRAYVDKAASGNMSITMKPRGGFVIFPD